jgi:hypothetical protein
MTLDALVALSRRNACRAVWGTEDRRLCERLADGVAALRTAVEQGDRALADALAAEVEDVWRDVVAHVIDSGAADADRAAWNEMLVGWKQVRAALTKPQPPQGTVQGERGEVIS